MCKGPRLTLQTRHSRVTCSSFTSSTGFFDRGIGGGEARFSDRGGGDFCSTFWIFCSRHKEIAGDDDPALFKVFDESGDKSHRLKLADDFSIFVEAFFFEPENFLKSDGVALHADDFRDAH